MQLTGFRAAAIAVGVTVAPGIVAASPAVSAPSEFARLQQLVGIWRVADKPDSPLRIRFFWTAGGTVLVEEWLRGTQPHSLTVYHRDGRTLIATHYCPQGNQPRLALRRPVEPNTLRFAFRNATNLNRRTQAYLIALAFEFQEPGRIVRRETYREAGKDEASTLQLVRE